MGAWDVGSFDNDYAADWAYSLEEGEDLKLVEDTFDRVFDEVTVDQLVEGPTGSEAIAACEVLARLKGAFGRRDAFSEAVDNWVIAHPIQPTNELLDKAARVLDVILSDKSELCNLWRETDKFAEWQASVADLQKRMNS
jgi:hypothetical protein